MTLSPKAQLTLNLLHLAYNTSWTLVQAYTDLLPTLDLVYPNSNNNDADLRHNLQVLNEAGLLLFCDDTGRPVSDRRQGTGRYRWAG